VNARRSLGARPSRSRRAVGRSVIALSATLAALPCLLPTPTAAATADVVQLRNGDRLTGDIKSLDRGKIRVETDATDTIEIKWEYVSSLESRQYFEVVLADGRVLYGSLTGDAKPTEVRVRSADALVSVPMPQIVRITPIESRLIDRIDMRVDVGYSLAKADTVTQGSVGYDFRYRATDNLVTFDLDASSALSEGEPRSELGARAQ
jgi:hypothetical protein